MVSLKASPMLAYCAAAVHATSKSSRGRMRYLDPRETGRPESLAALLCLLQEIVCLIVRGSSAVGWVVVRGHGHRCFKELLP